MEHQLPEPFWLQKPPVIFRSTGIIPQANWSTNAKLNALTRFVIVIVLLLFFLSFAGWIWFLLLGLGLVVLLFFLYGERSIQTFTCPKQSEKIAPVFVPYLKNW